MSATTSYIKPQMRLFHEVEEQYSGLVGALQAVVIGPHFDVKKYVAGALDNNYDLLAGDYVPGQENAFSWPKRPAGGIVDLKEVEVHVDDAYVRYFDGTSSASGTHLVTGTRTHLRSDTINWADYKSDKRSPLLPQRDVAIGDGVRVIIPVASVDMVSRVVGLAHDVAPATTGAIVPDSNNRVAEPASATVTPHFSTGSMPTVTTTGTYNGLGDDILTEMYTVTVTKTATGGDNDTAEILLTSDRGVNVPGLSPATGEITATELRGLTLTFDADGVLETGQTWRVMASSAYTVPTISLSGDYTGTMDTTYILHVVSDGIVGSAVSAPRVTVDTTNGIDITRSEVTLDELTFAIGNYGIEGTVTAGTMFSAGDQFTFDCTAKQDGRVATLIIADSLPEAVTAGMSVQVNLYLRKNIVLDEIKQGQAPYKNYESDLRGITLSPEVTYFEEAVVDAAGEQVRMILESGRIYVQYRSLIQTYSNLVHEMPSVGTEGETILTNIKEALGYYGPENPLSMGVYLASLNAGGTPVLYVSVKSDDLAGYTEAVGKLDARSGTYGIVPLTQDQEILDMIQGAVANAASPENCRWRILWATSKFTDQQAIITEDKDGNQSVMRVVSRVEDNGDFLTLEMDSGTFITKGVRPGDEVRFLYRADAYGELVPSETYIVDHVLSEDALKLVTGPERGYDVAMKTEIWRTLTPAEVAKVYAQRAGQYHDKRVRLVWPPQVEINNTEQPGYYLAAALAGVRSGVLPHQGLTNVDLRGFDGMALTTEYLKESDLNTMAVQGVWIVTQDINTMEVFTRHQLTTAGYDDVKRREDSVISNWDSISYRLRNLYRQYIGTSNLTTEFIAWFRLQVERDLDAIAAATGGDLFRGPQIVNYEILSFGVDPILPDTLVARIRFTGPTPMNNFDLYMVF